MLQIYLYQYWTMAETQKKGTSASHYYIIYIIIIIYYYYILLLLNYYNMNCTSIRHDELFSVRYPVSAHQRGQTKDRHKPKIVPHMS